MQDTEVEIKLRLPEEVQLLKFLEEHATLVRESFQKDTYFAPSHRDFLARKPINERLRIRESDKGNSINYKNRKEQDGKQLNYCDEYQTLLEKPDQIKKILRALNINPIITVNKKRKSFLYQEVEISIDEVEELGSFVEFEMKGEYSSCEAAIESLYILAEKLGLQRNQEDHKGYPRLLLEQKGIL